MERVPVTIEINGEKIRIGTAKVVKDDYGFFAACNIDKPYGDLTRALFGDITLSVRKPSE